MSGPSFAGTRLQRHEYVTQWDENLDLFIAAATGNLETRVPTCPEWNLRDLTHHLANVYEHKTWVLERGEFPSEDLYHEQRRQREHEDPLERVQRWSAELQEQLLARSDDDIAATFMPDDQSVKFWFRRMALETLVHRTDAEIAVDALSQMDEALSLDGIDELLWFWSGEPLGHDARWRGQRIGIHSPSITWTITLARDAQRVVVNDAAGHDAIVEGTAGDLLLWVAGRGLGAVAVDGDDDAIAILREALTEF